MTAYITRIVIYCQARDHLRSTFGHFPKKMTFATCTCVYIYLPNVTYKENLKICHTFVTLFAVELQSKSFQNHMQ